MAITVLSEFSFAKSGITSTLLSPFMLPVLYFKVSGAGAVTTPTAQIEFDGTTEDVTIDATFIKTVATEHYFFVDLSDIMKYLMASFDGADYPDDLEFINGNLLQSFDEYFRALEIDVYFERGTGDEQTGSANGTWLYLADQIPIDSGFNLWNIRAMEQLSPMKWIKDTYNALFFWLPNAVTTIVKVKQLITAWSNSATPYATFTTSGTAISSAITAGAAYAHSTIISNITSGEKVVLRVTHTKNSGQAPFCFLMDEAVGIVAKSNTVNLAAGANEITLTATADITQARVVIGNTAASDFLIGTALIYRAAYSGTPTAGFYQLKFGKSSPMLSEGLNTFEIKTTEVTKEVVIDYSICEQVPVCWQHPMLGYVSFPFNGSKQTNISSSKLSEYGRFLTSMKSVNSLKTITGYKETRKVTISTKADAQYWPLIESIYSSRHVYLFIGTSGDDDSTLSWVECEVSGGTTTRSDRNRLQFTVELTLPEHFNVSF